MNRKDFLALNWAPFLEKAATMKPHYRWLQSVHEPCIFLMHKAADCPTSRAYLVSKTVNQMHHKLSKAGCGKGMAGQLQPGFMQSDLENAQLQ